MGFQSRQPWLNTGLAGAGIGAVIGYPDRGCWGALVGAAAGVVGATLLVTGTVTVLWLMGKVFIKKDQEISI